ncbi:hypothetical protein KQI22_12920 [Kineothrix sp. MSJ-39]|uniref:hypothetical protein n=1 Tax=Kineothrix sp. MSJ-39 TaxID=2841533 RepID=UPI001C0F6EDD|nr:hypothetical protein [Kineothrix sp. MSJ-39]MBU5430951.1 hypothetical protein [Kineothrix sp. MSJ-39]
MRDRECWDTFYMSGKVADYLSYREAAESAENKAQSEEDAFRQQTEAKEDGDVGRM